LVLQRLHRTNWDFSACGWLQHCVGDASKLSQVLESLLENQNKLHLLLLPLEGRKAICQVLQEASVFWLPRPWENPLESQVPHEWPAIVFSDGFGWLGCHGHKQPTLENFEGAEVGGTIWCADSFLLNLELMTP
jgi:hypothetical protein